MKNSYSILLVVAVTILLVGFVALGISQNQESPIATSTSPPPQVPYTPYFDSSPSGMGYRDGYYGRPLSSPYYCDYEMYKRSGVTHLLTYDDYCASYRVATDEYTQGYIDGSIDRRVEERLEE